ncbi:MAG TPA: SulP family inorganic anion transporter [Rhizomicrobium sp.]|nr:SulP family inorganic anion transporter [Rhizomicrobium sp.]
MTGGFSLPSWPNDLLAGITVAAIALPEQMATARLGHFPPEIGLLAFVVASLGFFVFGASRALSVGADSTITPIFAGALMLATAGVAGSFQSAALLALMVGSLVLLAGVFRMGWISSLLSRPVTCGFLAGIALHIVSSQLPGFLGLPPVGSNVLSRFAGVAQNLPRTNLATLLLGCGVLVAVGIAEAADRRLPAALIGVAAATLCTVFFGLQHHGVQVLGAVPMPLPHFVLTWPTYDVLRQLAPLSVLLAFVVMVQTAATSRSASEDNPVGIDRDFIGVGVANILSGVAGAFPVNASPPRSIVAAQAGAQSKWAGLVAAGAVGLVATVGIRLLGFVPNAALAAILLFVAFRIVQFPLALQVWRESKPEFALIVATALAIVLLPIQTGVALGIALSLLHGMWTATRAQVIVLKRVRGTSVWWPPGPGMPQEETKGVLVLGFQAPLSFLNADSFRSGAMRYLTDAQTPLRVVVLEASNIVEMDFTAAHTLAEAINFCRNRGIHFAVARLESVRAQDSFTRFGIRNLVGNEHFYHSVYEAVEALAPGEARPE